MRQKRFLIVGFAFAVIAVSVTLESSLGSDQRPTIREIDCDRILTLAHPANPPQPKFCGEVVGGPVRDLNTDAVLCQKHGIGCEGDDHQGLDRLRRQGLRQILSGMRAHGASDRKIASFERRIAALDP